MISWTGLFVLCGVLSPALCCDWLQQHGHYSNISLTLIRLMGDQLTKQDGPVAFPYRLYSHIRKEKVESQLVFIRDSLQQIFQLFNETSPSCDAETTHRFLLSIERQIDGLSTCVPTNSRADVRLRKYYKRLAKSTLHHAGGGPVSCEPIRKETKLHLDQLELVAAVAASRRRSAPTPPQH